MKEEDLKGARSKLGLRGEVKSKTYEVMAECGEWISVLSLLPSDHTILTSTTYKNSMDPRMPTFNVMEKNKQDKEEVYNKIWQLWHIGLPIYVVGSLLVIQCNINNAFVFIVIPILR